MADLGQIAVAYTGYRMQLSVWAALNSGVVDTSFLGHVVAIGAPTGKPKLVQPPQPTLIASEVAPSSAPVYYIEGVSARDGQPESKTVRLYDRDTGLLINALKSDPNGLFRFSYLNPAKRYTLLVIGDSVEYNAVVLDLVQPKP